MTRTATFLMMGLILLLPAVQSPAQQPDVHAAIAASERRLLSAHAFPGLPAGEPIKCGLGIFGYARRNRATLSVEEQNALSRLLFREERQKTLRSGPFVIHYDTTGDNAAAMLNAVYQPIPNSADEYADSVAAVANRVFAIEAGELGYVAPPPDGTLGGGPEYDIYVENLVSYGTPYYGETMPEVPLDSKLDGGRFITFIRIHKDFSFVLPAANKGLPALRVTLAHEFHHMIQIGSYGYWGGDIFFHEIASTWMEDVVFPGVNDYLNYLGASGGHFKNPDRSFRLADGMIEYSRAIWGHFIAAKFGRDVMRAAWDSAMSARPLEAMDLVLRAVTHGTSNFRNEFIEWVLWNYHTGTRADSAAYYPKGASYPEIVQPTSAFLPPTGLLSGELAPLSARYHQVYTSVDTVVIIQVNINRESAEEQAEALFPYSVSLSASQVDDSYEQAGNSLFFKTSVSDPSNWKTMKIVHGEASFTGVAEGTPFPNPFRPDGRSLVCIPAQASYGTLNVYSSSMDLVFSAAETPVVNFGKLMFTWNGYTMDNEPARSGIYIFVLSIPGKTITGKIALIRK